MKRKVFRVSLAFVLTLVLIASLVVANIHQDKQVLKDVKVMLNDEDLYSFLNKDAIRQILIENRNLRLNEMSFEALDLAAMERIVLTNPWVKNADVFVDNNYVLNVKVEQRIPIARLFFSNGSNYYFDSAMYMMPPTAGFSFPTIMFTDVPVYKDEKRTHDLHNKIRYIASVLSENEFWQRQITQIAITPNEEFKASSLVGDQVILIGDTSRLKEKLDNLMAFYKDVAVKIGWEKYQQLDVRYKGQVVAYPSLGWVAPKAKDTLILLPDEANNINDIMSSLPEQPLIVKQNQQAAEKPKEMKSTERITKPKLDSVVKKDAVTQNNEAIKQEEKLKNKAATINSTNKQSASGKDTAVKKDAKTANGAKQTVAGSKKANDATSKQAVQKQPVQKKTDNTNNKQPKYTYPGQ